jgi:hypothetical protein
MHKINGVGITRLAEINEHGVQFYTSQKCQKLRESIGHKDGSPTSPWLRNLFRIRHEQEKYTTCLVFSIYTCTFTVLTVIFELNFNALRLSRSYQSIARDLYEDFGPIWSDRLSILGVLVIPNVAFGTKNFIEK